MDGASTASFNEHGASGSGPARDHHLGPYRSFRQAFRFTTTDPTLATLLDDLFHALLDPAPSVDVRATDYRITPPVRGRPGEVLRDGEVLGRTSDPASLLRRLLWAVNQHVTLGTAPDRLLLHAAAADLDGIGVLIPAQMGSGKSTLVAGLLDRGLSYLTDEAATVSPDLSLEGYAKPLSIDPGAWEVLAHHRPRDPATSHYFSSQWQIAPHHLAPIRRRTQLGLIVFRRFQPHTPLRLARLDAFDALRAAIATTFTADRPYPPEAHVRELAAVVEQVPSYSLVGGDLTDSCAAVLATLHEVAALPRS